MANLFLYQDVIPSANQQSPEDETVQAATKKAVIEGAQYSWISDVYTASLLWRTIPRDSQGLKGYSGTALCLGNRTDTEVNAVVFQNYQAALKITVMPAKERPITGYGPEQLLKGGILLPKEIRNCAIIVGTTETGQADGTNLEERESMESYS